MNHKALKITWNSTQLYYRILQSRQFAGLRMAARRMKVAKCPSDSLTMTNRAIVSPRDFDKQVKQVLCNSLDLFSWMYNNPCGPINKQFVQCNKYKPQKSRSPRSSILTSVCSHEL